MTIAEGKVGLGRAGKGRKFRVGSGRIGKGEAGGVVGSGLGYIATAAIWGLYPIFCSGLQPEPMSQTHPSKVA